MCRIYCAFRCCCARCTVCVLFFRLSFLSFAYTTAILLHTLLLSCDTSINAVRRRNQNPKKNRKNDAVPYLSSKLNLLDNETKRKNSDRRKAEANRFYYIFFLHFRSNWIVFCWCRFGHFINCAICKRSLNIVQSTYSTSFLFICFRSARSVTSSHHWIVRRVCVCVRSAIIAVKIYFSC